MAVFERKVLRKYLVHTLMLTRVNGGNYISTNFKSFFNGQIVKEIKQDMHDSSIRNMVEENSVGKIPVNVAKVGYGSYMNFRIQLLIFRKEK